MDYKQKLIELAIKHQALQFGQFRLKSGRQAPYFFNITRLFDGESLAILGQCYAARITELQLNLDGLFGPAYKGIPLVASTAISLATHYQQNVTWSFNRKEAKMHGEGGIIIGAPLKGNIILLDDVMTAGMALAEAMAIIKQSAATVVAMLVALDRQECANSPKTSALQEVAHRYQVPIYSLINFTDLLTYLQHQPMDDDLQSRMKQYWQTYGCKA